MSFSVLEKQVQELPLELQKRIEMYVLFVINQYKNSCPSHNRRPVAEVLDSLTGIIPDSESMSLREIRNERLSGQEIL